MYYLYFDETYNLREGSRDQFLAIAGFGTRNPRKITKIYKTIKKHVVPKRRKGEEIKSTDRLAKEKLRPRLFKKLKKTDIKIYAVYQYKRQLPFVYFRKDKLLYEQFYLDLLYELLKKITSNIQDRQVFITLDSFKTKGISKEEIASRLVEKLKQKYSNKLFKIYFRDSAGVLELQIADQICSEFNKKRQNRLIIKNPL